MRSAVALVNTAQAPDALVDVEQLSGFVDASSFTGRHDGDEEELAAVRQIRPTLRRLLTASCDDAVVLINQILGEGNARPQIVRCNGADWGIRVVDPDAPLATRIAVETAMAMADAIRMGETPRLGICADDKCNGLVFDLSRNRIRRYCSATCGNRAAAAAYRARAR